MSASWSVGLSVCQSIGQSVGLSVNLSVCWSVCLGNDLEMCYFREKLFFISLYLLSRSVISTTFTDFLDSVSISTSFLRNLSCGVNKNFDKEINNSNFNLTSEKQQLKQMLHYYLWRTFLL